MRDLSTLPLHIDRLHVTRKGNSLLCGIDYSINTPGVTTILGPNGAGKSLLLQVMHGLVTPDKGFIRWNVHKPQPWQSWRAFVFQKPVLLRRSIRANLEYVLSLHKIAKDERKQRTREALSYTGLFHLADRNARVLSGGEQQRLNIARALVLRPQVILLDEPTAELDPTGTAAIERLIKDIAQHGAKVIMTTHDLSQARRLASDILFLNNGKLLEYSPALAFFKQPRTHAAQNFIAGKLLNDE